MPRRSQISVGTLDDRSKNVFHWPRPGDREGVGMDRDALQQLFDMSGRVVVVTGGTRGIGLALAEGYVAAGAKVVVASRKADACERRRDTYEVSGVKRSAWPPTSGDSKTSMPWWSRRSRPSAELT